MMKTLRNDRGVVMIAALGIIVALAGLSLVVATSGQMSTLTGAIASQAAAAFYAADGGAYYSLGDNDNFDPNVPTRVVDLATSPASLPSTVTSSFVNYRALPGNLLIRTTDGRVRAAQFGQNEGLGKMYYFRLDSVKNKAAVGVDPASRVQMEAAKPGPCADCGS
ncbi:MAG: hypothetical protein FJ144_01505 [Deltaproteobacteria bacterium]|nr:hypothetical protein [Deltaproteobacteria bacterium]